MFFRRRWGRYKEIKKLVYGVIETLSVKIGQRNLTKYDSLEATRKYINGMFRELGGDPQEQVYYVNDREVANIYLRIEGEDKSLPKIVLGGHYDTVDDTPGADDNATAVAALLAVYKLLSTKRLQRTVEFVAFTLEEPPHYSGEDMGSIRYAKRMSDIGENVSLMIAMDMLGFGCRRCKQGFPTGMDGAGYPKHGDYPVVVSYVSQSSHVFNFKSIFNDKMKQGIYEIVGPASMPGIALSDHSSFVKYGFPAIMITDTAFYRNKNYHAPTDTIETINFKFLMKNVEGIYRTVWEMAGKLPLDD